MSETTTIVLVVAGLIAVIAFFTAMFGAGSGRSNFETLVGAWRDKRLAELEVEKLKAQHERVCPRLTDKPRGT